MENIVRLCDVEFAIFALPWLEECGHLETFQRGRSEFGEDTIVKHSYREVKPFRKMLSD